MTKRILEVAAKMALPLLVAAFALPVFGMDVTYTSTGEFCTAPGPCANSTPLVENPAHLGITVGTVPTQYTYFGAQAVTATVDAPSQAVAAQFDVSDNGSNARTVPVNEVYTIYITQTNPAAGTGTFVGGFSGNVAFGSTTATITFSNTTIVLGGFTYTLDSNVYTLPKISIPSHSDQIMMEVTQNTAPEPTFMALSGLGFAGLAFVAYRRKRTV
jgi:hypothetical protein